MVKLQDITAEVLKMKRGERSGRVHMESHEYKITAQLEKVKKLEAQNKALLRRVKELEVQKQELEEIVGDLDLECTNLAQENEELKIKIQENKSQFDEIYEMNRQEYQEKAKKLTKEEANLKASIQELTSKNIELKEIVKRLNINIDKVEECTVNNLEQTLTNLTKSIKKCYPNEIERDIFYNQAKTYLNHFKSKEPNTAATAIHMNILKLAGEARRLQRLEKKKGMGI